MPKIGTYVFQIVLGEQHLTLLLLDKKQHNIIWHSTGPIMKISDQSADRTFIEYDRPLGIILSSVRLSVTLCIVAPRVGIWVESCTIVY